MRTSLLVSLGIGLAASIFALACSKQNGDALTGQGGTMPACDTVNMHYTADVLPILQSFCYSCHGNGSTGGSGGISLDGYDNLKKWAGNGYLIGNITHATGFVPMPYQLPKLSDCNINIISDWVLRGALND